MTDFSGRITSDGAKLREILRRQRKWQSNDAIPLCTLKSLLSCRSTTLVENWDAEYLWRVVQGCSDIGEAADKGSSKFRVQSLVEGRKGGQTRHVYLVNASEILKCVDKHYINSLIILNAANELAAVPVLGHGFGSLGKSDMRMRFLH